ncbi:glycoside hydrolase family 128 protein [Amniculicola lignicola CBS 123094]|uniref:Glycoside hydrolase family 128 protein n=1 Tax=Amniculicola lignicola CBS 123094 TaxID=1392246 RepID=A0A6A5W486_9PLEO|nr:glycoside hydrolase family 128 protein [Amniculicola lignicola CBS 123094]
MPYHQSRRSQPPSISQTTLLLLSLFSPTSSQKTNSKRGLASLGSTHTSDNSLLGSPSSPLFWYYNWSPYPLNAPSQTAITALEFVPLIHGIYGAEDSQTSTAINSLPSTSKHLLSFNEPDGTTDSGGSSIEPEDAARAYIEHIVPYRTSNRKWLISHPSVTGSPRGLEWLRQFNESCWEIDEENGCPTDFIAAHWYGAYDGLTGWLSQLDEYYKNGTASEQDLKIWITELALPQQSEQETVNMMNVTLPYLDELDYVERYAWFGDFRRKDADEWAGDNVAMFDDDGGLTALGALYLGGEANGFEEGQEGKGEGAASSVKVNTGMMASVFAGAVVMVNWL